MLDLDLLQAFSAVHRHESFRSAARALRISQSTLTKRIKRLEADLGASLFDRTTRSVRPTSAGLALIERAEALLRSADAFNAAARLQAEGNAGRIRIGAIAIAAETVLLKALAALSRTHPELEAEVIVGGRDIYRDLAAGRCDVAIGDEANFLASPHAGVLRKTNIGDEAIVLIARSAHPHLAKINRGVIKDYALAIPSRYYDENRLFDDNTALPKPRYRLNSLTACLRLAETSDVLTIAPMGAAEAALSHGARLTRCTVPLDLKLRLLVTTHADRKPGAEIRAFQQALR